MKVFEITTEHVCPFKYLFENIRNILPETVITITNNTKDKSNNGLKIRAFDGSETMLFDMFLKASEFEVFKCSKKNLILVYQ